MRLILIIVIFNYFGATSLANSFDHILEKFEAASLPDITSMLGWKSGRCYKVRDPYYGYGFLFMGKNMKEAPAGLRAAILTSTNEVPEDYFDKINDTLWEKLERMQQSKEYLAHVAEMQEKEWKVKVPKQPYIIKFRTTKSEFTKSIRPIYAVVEHSEKDLGILSACVFDKKPKRIDDFGSDFFLADGLDFTSNN